MQVSTFRIGEGMNVTCERIGVIPSGLQVCVYRAGEGLNVICSRLEEGVAHLDGITAVVHRIGRGLNVTCGIVCTVEEDFTHEWFLVEEGYFVFSDGLKFKVLKNGISE
jgi:hypothetical protein